MRPAMLGFMGFSGSLPFILFIDIISLFINWSNKNACLLLYSDDRQFGFKENMGCRNEIFAVRNIINHFNERGSSAFIASLDALWTVWPC